MTTKVPTEMLSDAVGAVGGAKGGSVVDGTYTALGRVPKACTIAWLDRKAGGGSATITVKINGVAVTGLNAITIDTTRRTTNASGANALAAGDIIEITIASSSSLTNIDYTIGLNE